MTAEIPIQAFEVYASGLDHPECVAFDRAGNLWAGGEGGQIYRIDPSGRVHTVGNIGGFCCGLAFAPDDELFVCCSGQGIVHVSRAGQATPFTAGAGMHRIASPNFAVFRRNGTMFVTDSGHWKRGNGYILRFGRDGRGEVAAGPFGYANGLALSGDEARLYMVESDTRRVYRFNLADDGSPGPRELFAGEVGRLPDGLAFDADGNLYVACYASDEIWRIATGGERTLVAHDPDAILLSRPTNIAFGGGFMYVANLGRQTVTRARIGRAGQPLANQTSETQG
ncbi:MAG: SMP-30/gluconolactonase/LRE family protein [Acidobacteria bacterium]|nr:SMP-30/gluconolactonase/LRE family protein [Acidobacteriota bacterium]